MHMFTQFSIYMLADSSRSGYMLADQCSAAAGHAWPSQWYQEADQLALKMYNYVTSVYNCCIFTTFILKLIKLHDHVYILRTAVK